MYLGVSKKPYYSFKLRKSDEEEDEDGPRIDLSKIIGVSGIGSHSGITRNHNHIYFYTDVSTQSCLELNKELINLTKELQRHSLDYDCEPSKIYLHINSYGGELLACFSTVDYIKNSPIPVVSIIEGCAASAATLISVVAKERYMTPNSWMLIHQLRGGYWGKYDDMEEDLGNSKKFMEKIYDIYEEHTKLSRKDLRRMLKRDEWWDYNTCLGYGLVDGVNVGMDGKVNVKKRVDGRKSVDGVIIGSSCVETRSKKNRK
jgi:ATP-dependent protease ClpP protease subunit